MHSTLIYYDSFVIFIFISYANFIIRNLSLYVENDSNKDRNVYVIS